MATTDNISDSAAELLVFADDWGRHPSSCQHLIRELLPELPTLWVNTIGTRKPKFDLATLRRGCEKLGAWLRRPAISQSSLPPNLQVVSPRMWPYFTRAHDRWLNRRLLVNALAPRLRDRQQVTAITTLPLLADLPERLPVRRWVYYCVDDFSQWPGLDGRTLERMERELVRRVDTIVAASAVLQQRLASLGRESHLLTHGVDLEHWQTRPAVAQTPLYPDLPQPWIVFWGLIDRRLDVAWLEALSQRITGGSIVLVGPTQDVDPRIGQLRRVALRPALPFAQLPQLARQAAVLCMPYADLPVTRAMQPLKLLEYLATGQPVVVRDLPAVAPWRDALDACDSAETFVERIVQRLTTGLPAVQKQARERLAAESWRAKAQQFREWL